MESYEYKVIEDAFTREYEEKEINEWAQKGWELICAAVIDTDLNTTRLYFRSPRNSSD